MRSNVAFCLVFISIFLVSSCDIFNGNTAENKGIKIKTSMASGVAPMDVLQNEVGIFILGITQKPAQAGSIYNSFYLAKIDQQGQLLWEQTYGSPKGWNRPRQMIATSDNHLLLAGYTTKDFANTSTNRAMHVVKADFSGKVIWEKSYLFKDGNGKDGNSSGNAAVEVSDGYIVGGKYSTDIATNSGGALLTKISFDGEKIWSTSVTKNQGVISGLINGKKPDHFDAIGYFPNANVLSFKNAGDGPAQAVNFTDNPFSADGIARNDKYIFISNNAISPQDGASKVSLYKISRDNKDLLAQRTFTTKNPNNRQISFDTSVLPDADAIISTGYVEDHENAPGKTKAYAIKINSDLSTDWQFIGSNASKPEQAVGAFSLTDGGVGVIVNARTPISNPCDVCSENIAEDFIRTSINSNIILYRLDKDGKVR